MKNFKYLLIVLISSSMNVAKPETKEIESNTTPVVELTQEGNKSVLKVCWPPNC